MTLRALLVVLLLALVAGTPGLGLETRTDSSALLGYLYAIPFLGALGGLIASWRWRRTSNWFAWIGAVSAAVLSALDIAGLTDGQPPAAVVAVEIVAIVASLGILVLTARRVVRPA